MSRNKPAYQQVFESLSNRIYSGVYRSDASLPSIAALAREYGVSVITIRGALELLKQDGLICTQQGREAAVALEGKTTLLRNDYARWMLEHKESVLDLYRLHADLIPQAIAFGAAHGGEKTLEELNRIRKNNQKRDLTGVLETLRGGMLCVLSGAGNALLLRLYGAIEEFIRVPTLLPQDDNPFKQHILDKSDLFLELLAESMAAGDYANIYFYVRDEYAGASRRFMNLAVRVSGMAQVNDSVPFRFALRPEYDLRYQEIANDLFLRIFCGSYAEDTLLPSAGALEARYCAAPATIRRALAKLEDEGMTRTINGVGTRVLYAPKAGSRFVALSREEAVEAAEALQILTLALPFLIREKLNNLNAAALFALSEQLEAIAKTKQEQCFLCAVLYTLICACDSCVEKELLLQILRIFSGAVRGSELPRGQKYAGAQNEEMRGLTDATLKCVKERDSAQLRPTLYRQMRAIHDAILLPAFDGRPALPFYNESFLKLLFH